MSVLLALYHFAAIVCVRTLPVGHLPKLPKLRLVCVGNPRGISAEGDALFNLKKKERSLAKKRVKSCDSQLVGHSHVS